MKIILKEDVANLGFKNDVVEVKPGYGRNFLIPKGIAVIASESALKVHAENLKQQANKLAAIKSAAEAVAKKLDGVIVKIAVKTSATGAIYGSVSASMVADKLEEMGFTDINRKMLQLSSTIKETGSYIAKVRLHKEVFVELPVEVSSENEPNAKVATKESGDLSDENVSSENEEIVENA